MDTGDETSEDETGRASPGGNAAETGSSSRHVGVVVNPERTGVSDDVIHRLRSAGCTVTVARPDSPAGLRDEIARLVADGVDVVAAVGGDGTQRTAATAMLDTDVALAVIPAGTVNLLAQVLGVDDIERAVAAAANGRTRTVDVGLIQADAGADDVFVLNGSSGWDAAVIAHVGDETKRFGRLGYATTGLVQWFRSEPNAVTVEVDGHTWYDEPALTVVVMNVGERGSASLHLAPDAEFDDGHLDVLVLRRHSALGFARSTWNIVRGRAAPSTDVRTVQGAEIVVTWARVVPVQRDGDACEPAACVRYRAAPRRLRVMVPATHS
ncbi:MAG: diacylglycerol kinase family protein [Ilumatobacteraceae bacterium]